MSHSHMYTPPLDTTAQTFHQELPFYDFQVPESHGLHLDMDNFNYCQGFGTDPPPYHSQRTTDCDWDLSCVNPIQVSSPFEARQSPPFPGPSRTSQSSQSDSESSFRLSPFSPAALLSPSPPAARRPLQEKRAKVITESAASPPVVREAVFHIVHSPEWETQQEVNGDLLMPIVEAVLFPNGGRSGSRGGIDRYRCLFGACGKVIKRRDHMLNHVRCHLGLKPWVCGFAAVDKQCGTRFLRVDDLKRHLRHIHKLDMDENGTYFPVPNRVKQVRGPRKTRRPEPYPTYDASDDEYKPVPFATRRGRTGLYGRRYHPILLTPRLSCFGSSPETISKE